ncbi:hypothetical protein KR074_011212 [Drosophila pseudoananassae]|nr:hypothetical protein KR074_011212 [Drosophila pseudoananassae]
MSQLSLIVLGALLGCLVASGAAGVVPSQRILVVKDIKEFVAQNPSVHLQAMEKKIVLPKARDAGLLSVRYNLGARISGKFYIFKKIRRIIFHLWISCILLGDRLVAQSADTYSYSQYQDVSLQLTYPESGAGAIVSYVEIVCTQDDSDGSAYVVAGGIGQRFISIVLEANNTKNFSYQVQYYGQN